MAPKRRIAGALGFSCAALLVTTDMTATPAAAAPCEPVFTKKAAPEAPASLRILAATTHDQVPLVPETPLSGSHEEPSFGARADRGKHSYFDNLSSRGDCMVAYHMRSQEQLDKVETRKKGISQKGEQRFPIIYDSAIDGALVRIDPRKGSTDGESKRFATAIKSGSMLLTWELRFNEGHKYSGSGYLGRHKTFQIGWKGAGNGHNRWLGMKTEYKNAAQARQGVAELFFNMVGRKYHGPGTKAGGQQILEPRRGKFFIEANTWTRVWIWLQDIDKSVAYLSVWVADEKRDPVQLYDRLAVVPPDGGITTFWLEYDTSGEDALNGEMRSWNRNLVVLKNPSAGDIKGLLQRPQP